MKGLRIPENIKKIPRCPLCFATFDVRVIPSRVGDWWLCATCQNAKPANKENPAKLCPGCKNDREPYHADGKAFMCHFDKIIIMANDPMVGRWEEVYAKGEKILCPACDHEMRYFCSSTGYMQAKCPVKKCQAKVETTNPDRLYNEAPLTNSAGEPIALPGVNRAIATPEAPGLTQVGGDVAAPEGLPSEVEIKLPRKELEGNA